MEEFDSEDFSTSDEDEDYVPSGERFGLRRKEGGSHASRLTQDSRGPQGVGLVVARPPRRVGPGVPVLRTLASSRPGTRVCRFCTAVLLGRRPLGAREQARDAGRLSVLSIAQKPSGIPPGHWRLF